MSASLVGSEMCIRDRLLTGRLAACDRFWGQDGQAVEDCLGRVRAHPGRPCCPGPGRGLLAGRPAARHGLLRPDCQ
eukprot:10930366-Alexandrium_andersonii.AAC.1